jgi:hypothetical protein
MHMFDHTCIQPHTQTYIASGINLSAYLHSSFASTRCVHTRVQVKTYTQSRRKRMCTHTQRDTLQALVSCDTFCQGLDAKHVQTCMRIHTLQCLPGKYSSPTATLCLSCEPGYSCLGNAVSLTGCKVHVSLMSVSIYVYMCVCMR